MTPHTSKNVLLFSELLVQPPSCYFASAAEAMPFPKLALLKSLRSFAALDSPFDLAQVRLSVAVPMRCVASEASLKLPSVLPSPPPGAALWERNTLLDIDNLRLTRRSLALDGASRLAHRSGADTPSAVPERQGNLCSARKEQNELRFFSCYSMIRLILCSFAPIP